MDFEAELAAFAEIEQLAEQTVAEDASQPSSSASAAAASSSNLAASSSSVTVTPAISSSDSTHASKGVKRKVDSSTTESGPRTKRIQISSIVSSSAPVLNTNVEPTPPPVASAYAQIVEADRKALIARQQQQQHSNVSTSNSDVSTASTAAHADGTTLDGSNGDSTTESYIPGQVYNGWLAGLSATGEPCWLPATPENLAEYALRAQQAADAEATAASLAKKQTKASKEAAAAAAVAASAGSTSTPSSTTSAQSAKHLRTAAGKVWNDPTLEDWPENDYRIFCGDLGNDVTDALLSQAFQRWPSFVKARVVRDKRTGKTKGFGFASFLDPNECVEALKTIDGKYVGNRPVKLRKSQWTKREATEDKTWAAKHNQFGNTGFKGDKKLHLY